MRVSFLALLALTLVSCDTYHHEQYKVSRAANVGDRAKVKHLLASIASSSGFHDCYPISRAPHTVAFYCEMEVIPYSGAQLGAREVDDSIIVDLLHSLGSQTRAFNGAHKLLEPALAAAFGQRLSVVNIRLKSCTPTDLTRRWSQPLAALKSTFDLMKQFSMFATLAAASGGSAPSR